MRKLLRHSVIAALGLLALVGVSELALGQCTGIFGGKNVCGNSGASNNTARPTPIYSFNIGATLLRSAIPTTNLGGTDVIELSGCTVVGDTGAGILYKKGTVSGPNAIADSTGQFYEVIVNGEVRPEMWCAAGNGTTDDASALNSAISYMRSQATSGGKNPVQLAGMYLREGANYLIQSSGLNFTALTNTNFVMYGNSAAITCKVTGGVCVDAIASQSMTWRDLTIRGDETDRPAIGIQYGRETQDASRSDNRFFNITVVGYFSSAAVINSSSEINSFDGTVTNRAQTRSSYALVIDANNTMNLDTAFSFPSSFTQTNGPWRGLVFSSTAGGNFIVNRFVKGATSGAVGKIRGRNSDNLYISVANIVGTFTVGETIQQCTSSACSAFDGRTGTLSRITYWARPIGDIQSTADIQIEGAFRKTDLTGQQLGTGWAVRLVGPTAGNGTIKQFRFRGYTGVLDSAGIKIESDCYNCFFDTHGETQQPVSQTPTSRMVVVDGSGNPITSFVNARTLTGGTSGTVGTITGYTGDMVNVTVTPGSTVLTGTVTVVNGSPTLTGAGTLFLTELARSTPVTITDTGETYSVLSVTSDTVATLTTDVTTGAAASAATKGTGKFVLGETVTESVSGATGTVDSGYGPVAAIDVTSSGDVWLEHFKFTDHNPHAYNYVIQKRNGSTLTITNANVDIRATNWDVPVFHPASGGFGNITYHGQMWLGEGGAQGTTQLKNLSNAQRYDGMVYSRAQPDLVTMPAAGDFCIFGPPTAGGTDPSRSTCRFSGYVTADFRMIASATVAAASTTIIGNLRSNRVDISGSSTTINSFGANVDRLVFGRFTGSNVTLTHNATSLILPNNGNNIVAQAGDTFIATSDSSGNWRVRHYMPAKGTSPAFTSFVQGDIPYASASGVMSALAKNASSTRYLSNQGSSNNPSWNQVNLANGVTGVLPVANGGSGGGSSFSSVTMITATGTYNTPANARTLYVECVGGGGGGGYATGVAAQSAAGGGGGGGGYAALFISSPSATYAVTIGAGGNGGIASSTTAATSGTDTTFGAGLTAKGGTAGGDSAASAAVQAVSGGAGGAIGSAVGDFRTGGFAGGAGFTTSTTTGVSGYGGGTAFGAGAGAPRAAAANGQGGSANTGTGGSGGLAIGATGRDGGNGGSGICRVFEYL